MKRILLAVFIMVTINGGIAFGCNTQGSSRIDYPGNSGWEINTCKNGKLNGPFQIFSAQGILIVEGFIKDDQLQGKMMRFYPSGKKMMEDNKVNGKSEGTTKVYYENGALKGEHRYLNGKLNGMSKEYYMNGKVKSKISWSNNDPMSMSKFDEQGKLLAELSPKEALKDLQTLSKDLLSQKP